MLFEKGNKGRTKESKKKAVLVVDNIITLFQCDYILYKPISKLFFPPVGTSAHLPIEMSDIR